MKHIFKKAFLFSSILALTSFSAGSAKAGFEWRPPQDNRAQDNGNAAQGSVQAQPQQAPIPQVTPQPIAPVQVETPKQVPVQTQVEAPRNLVPPPVANAPQQLRVQDFEQPVAPPSVVPSAVPTAVVSPRIEYAPKEVIVRPVTMPPVASPVATQKPVEIKPIVKQEPVQQQEPVALIAPPTEVVTPVQKEVPVQKPAPVATTPIIKAPKQELAQEPVKEVVKAPKILPPVKHMNLDASAELNRPIRVKRDPLPVLYSDEAPIILGKTPRERVVSSAYQTPVVSETNNVTIFDPDADNPMPMYSDIETPREFARGFDDNFMPSSLHSPVAPITPVAAPQSILPEQSASVSEPMIEDPIQFEPIPAPVETKVVETKPEPKFVAQVEPASAPTLKTEDYEMASPLPVVSRSIAQEPVAEPVAEMTPTLMPVPTDGTVQGFGTRVPLVIATRQIAPEGYEFDFAQGVDIGALVDWQGGQSWENVMESTLVNYGLVFSTNETTKIISIYKPGQAPQSSYAPTLASAPVVTPAYEPVAIAPDPYADMRSATAAVERQVDVVPVQPAVQPAVNNATIVSSTTEFASARVVPTTKDTPAVAQVKVAQELPQVSYQASDSQAADGSVWYGAKDSTLRSVLRDWSSKANVELYWDSQFDYPLQATVVVKGTFEDAVQRVLEGFEQAQPRPLGRLHKNADNGPDVLIVEANDLID